METIDFLRFRFITLNGPAAQNKGMAIFPRKINGLYAMLSRQDSESVYLMFSDNVHFWNEREILLTPTFPWELVQLGNCGSPIETDAGWLAQPWCRPYAKVLHWRVSADREDPESNRPPSRAHDQTQPKRTGRLRAQRCLYVRRLIHKGKLVIPHDWPITPRVSPLSLLMRFCRHASWKAA
jgi:hypothetical protein